MFAQFGEPLLIYGRRPPASWPEVCWCAGQEPEQDEPDQDDVDEPDEDVVPQSGTSPRAARGPRLFLAAVAAEIKAILAHADGLVEARGFGESWEVAGRIPSPTPI
jgi:hypothetical protein